MDIKLIEEEIIPIMQDFIQEKQSLHLPSEINIESWLRTLLEVAFKGEEWVYTKMYSYIRTILDDPKKCLFFIEKRSRDEISRFLTTLII